MTVRTSRWPVCKNVCVGVIAAGAFVVAAGCQMDHGSSTSTRREDRSSAMRAGASTSGAPQGIPSAARPMAQGRDNVALTFRAPSEGTVYVYDATSRRVVWSGPARAQANVVVDPAADAVTVNDQQAGAMANPASPMHTDLDPNHDYQLWFAGR